MLRRIASDAKSPEPSPNVGSSCVTPVILKAIVSPASGSLPPDSVMSTNEWFGSQSVFGDALTVAQLGARLKVRERVTRAELPPLSSLEYASIVAAAIAAAYVCAPVQVPPMAGTLLLLPSPQLIAHDSVSPLPGSDTVPVKVTLRLDAPAAGLVTRSVGATLFTPRLC